MMVTIGDLRVKVQSVHASLVQSQEKIQQALNYNIKDIRVRVMLEALRQEVQSVLSSCQDVLDQIPPLEKYEDDDDQYYPDV